MFSRRAQQTARILGFSLGRIGAAVALLALLVGAPASPASAARGDCGQVVSNGSRPSATDALAILKAAVSQGECALCVCDADASGSVVATDALLVLKFAVGTAGLELNCVPCQVCGDGVLTEPEQCDDGDSNDDSAPDACRSDCTAASCGDGVVDSAEQCEPPDQGNCNALCQACDLAVELCNGVDDDCNGQVDEGLGQQSCGVGPCENTVDLCVDGAPNTCQPLPPQPEICDNEIDEDCDGSDCVTLSLDLVAPGRIVTRNAQLTINGTADPRIVSVTVGGVVAELAGARGTEPVPFSATVLLDPGPNMIVAVGRDAAGNQGVDSFSITLDQIAPNIAIDSPTDGIETTAATTTVTGLVADLVSGGKAPRVFVGDVEAPVTRGSFMVTGVPLKLGSNTISALARDAAGNSRSTSVQVTRRNMAGVRIAIDSGEGQAAVIGNPLFEPLVVRVTDDMGNPLAGRVVTFEVLRNDGVLSSSDGRFGQRKLTVATNGNGLAEVDYHVGLRAGQGNNRVRATALGAVDQAVFCASGLPAQPQQILELMGNNQTGIVSAPLPDPFEVLVVDVDGNPIAGLPVLFRVLAGGGSLDGSEELQLLTDDDGEAQAVLTLGPATGVANNVVEVSYPNIGSLAVQFLASAVAAGAGSTQFSGVVLDNSNTPIPGALVVATAVGIPDVARGEAAGALTDEQGQFFLEDVPVGSIEIEVLPESSSRPEIFPPIFFRTTTIAGRVNTLATGPIRLPELISAGQTVGGDEDVVVEMPGVPGMSLTVLAGSATFPDGSKVGTVSLNQVHLDKVPMPPPSGTIFMPPAWTVQPAGVLFDPPAAVSVPNDGLAPGRVIDIFQFDHDINRFVNVGPGTVSEDGLVIRSDAGFGVTRSGWGGCGQPQPPTTCAASCDDGNPCTTDSCVEGQCKNDPAADGATCGTQTGCTARVCMAGSCVDQDRCDDMDPCTTDRCFEGNCFNDPIFEGGMCDNGKQCVDGICEEGECVDSLVFPTGPCDDGDNCTQMDMCELGICSGMPLELEIEAKVDGQDMSRRAKGCAFNFTAQVTTNCKGSLVVEWTFGDGFRGGGTSTSHAYLQIGSYTATAKVRCGACDTEATDSVVAKVSPEIVLDSVTPVGETRLGRDTTIRYSVNSIDAAGFDSVRAEIVNKSGETVLMRNGLPTAPGTHTTVWTDGKWVGGAHGGAFANPNENPHRIEVIGTLAGCEDKDSRDHDTKLVLEFDVEDKLSGAANTASFSSGLRDVGDALKVVMKDGMNETVFSGAQLTITGAMDEEKHVVVDQPGLNTLPDASYEVRIRDLRDFIGNFADDDGNPDNGIQEPSFNLELR